MTPTGRPRPKAARDKAKAARDKAKAARHRPKAVRHRPKAVPTKLSDQSRGRSQDGPVRDVAEAGVPGRVVDDRTIPAGGEWSGVVPEGQVFRIVDLEGRQAVDFLCYNAADPSERYNAADTMKFAGTIFLTTGHGLYSGLGRRLFTIVADTCGRHDTIGGCCSAESNRLRYGVEGTPNCRDNFLRALGRFGLDRKDIVANLNFFMNVPVAGDGAMAIVDGWSKAGDHVDLRAETDVLVAVSNCPQIHNPCNGGRPTPIRLVTYEPAGGPTVTSAGIRGPS